MSNFFEAGKAAMTSNKDDWETPQSLFDELDAIYHFGIDVASTHENAKCAVHFTSEEDGLSQSWDGHGTVWCNPPYGRISPKWIEKMAEEAAGGGTHRRTAPSAHRHARVPRPHLQEAQRPHRVRQGKAQVRGGRRTKTGCAVPVDARIL